MLRGTLRAAGMDVERELAGIATMVPLGRICVPEDIAQAVCFLLSERASMINAVDLNVDGAQWVAVAATHSAR